MTQQQPTLTPIAQEELEAGFDFFLNYPLPHEPGYPQHDLSAPWLDGILTVEEGKRIVEGRQLWQ